MVYPLAMSAEKNFVMSLREVVQDLLVPELKAVKVSIHGMRDEMKLRNENLERMINYRDDRNEQLIRTLSDKLDFAIEFRERLSNIELRMPKQ